MVVVPVIGMLVAQSMGVAVVSLPIIGGLTVAVALLDLALGWFAVQVFERETILTRWTGL